MAHSPCRTNQQAPGAAISSLGSRKEEILALFSHSDLFNDIGNNHRPEGDIRQRYYTLRAIRAAYTESSVREAGNAYYGFMDDVGQSKLDLDCEYVGKRFAKIMDDLDIVLQRVSRIFEEDSRAAQAPVVTRYLMDTVFRRLTQGKATNRAPNGEFLSLYGSMGELATYDLAATRECEDDTPRRIILERLLPLASHIYIRCWKSYKKLRNQDPTPEPEAFSGRTLHVLVTAVEGIIVAFCLAGSMALLSIIDSMGNRIITSFFLSLAFPYAAVSLSAEARGMFILQAGFWAVVAVFIAASGSGSKVSCQN